MAIAAIIGLVLAPLTAEEEEEKSQTSIQFSGYLDADVAVDVTNEFQYPQYQTNQEVDLTSDIKFNKAVSVQLYTTFLHGSVPYGGGDPIDRWNGLAFDGLALTWNIGEHTALYIGDMIYNAGSLGYYAYKRPVFYGLLWRRLISEAWALTIQDYRSMPVLRIRQQMNLACMPHINSYL